MKKLLVLFIFITICIIILLAVFIRNNHTSSSSSSCVSCHREIETVSETHKDIACVECHGGNEFTDNKDLAHKDMYGESNPSSPKVWDKTCGKCHEYEVKRVSSTIMLTNTGIIKNTLAAWGESDNKSLFSQNHIQKAYGDNGSVINISSIADNDNISADMYRKFCSGCHVGQAADMGYLGVHSSGCAACHFPYGEYGEYAGADKNMQGKYMHSVTHKMQSLPNDDVCLACHNRSGRIALSYKGLYDGNNALVPTKDGFAGPLLTSGLRNVRHFQADIHHAAGMECIDCHTSNEIMGDGYYYENMYDQIEISCESCHGSYTEKPKTKKETKENTGSQNIKSAYAKNIPFGSSVVLTDKERPFSNVYKKNGEFILISKRSGIERNIKIITGTKEHNIKGHNNMECYSCHSANVVQCYGCHVEYDERQTMYDYVKDKETKGAFKETEDIRIFFPFPLAYNQKGKISPVTPGCQTFLTHIDENGNVISEDKMVEFRGRPQMKYAPFFGHNIGKKAVDCEVCHSNTAFLGFGDSLFSYQNKTLTSSIKCDNCPVSLNAVYSIENGKFLSKSDIVRDGSKVLEKEIMLKSIDAMKCLICHNNADEKYYNRDIDYEKILNDSNHKHLID